MHSLRRAAADYNPFYVSLAGHGGIGLKLCWPNSHGQYGGKSSPRIVWDYEVCGISRQEMTEGRCTGIPKIHTAMKRNGSPRRKLTTDELRTWFLVELPVHRAFATQVTAQVTAQVSPEMTAQVVAILKAAETPCFRDDLQAAAGIKHRKHFRKQYLLPMLEAG